MHFRTAIAALLIAFVTSVGVPAQEPHQGIDYEAWDLVAERTEAAVEAGRASDRAFESLREEIVVWRERFLRDLDANATRIETLAAELDALGTAPESGAPEPEGIADRRVDLTERLAVARAPVRAAEVAYARADGLAGEIDAIVRDRRAGRLLRKEPFPLNPVYWVPALDDLAGSLNAVGTEIAEVWSSDVRFRLLIDGLPRIVLFLALSALMLFRGPTLLRRVAENVRSRMAERSRRLMDFAVSFGDLALPLLGILLLERAIEATGLLGARGELIAGFIPFIGLCVLGADWLASRLVPDQLADGNQIGIEKTGRSVTAWRSAVLLGLMAGLSALLESLASYEGYSEASTAVLLFPVAAVAAFSLWAIGRTVRSYAIGGKEENPAAQTPRWLGALGRTLTIIAALGAVLAAVGYLNAGLYLLVASGLTLAVLALVYLLNDFLHELYGLALGLDESAARSALVPTLLGLALALASVPVLALIWGARIADLTEFWARFREGFTFGDVRVAPENALSFAIVFVVLLLATRAVQAALRSNVLPKTRIDPGGQVAIVSGIGYVGIFLAALLATAAAGINLSSIAFVAGALSIGIGFGLQNIVQNFVSGIILLIERPVSEGDWIQVGEHVGIVKKVSVRSTLIQTFDRTDVIVPNGDFISGSVTNWTRGNNIGRIKVSVGVAYGTDTRRVARILYEIASEHPVVTEDPEPGVDFLGFGADSLDFRIRAVLSDVNQSVSVMSELNHRIAERFVEEGIEIPFAQRDIWLRNPETLHGTYPGVKAVMDDRKEPLPLKDDLEIDPEVTDDDGEGDTP